jgi:hypothetical protein
LGPKVGTGLDTHPGDAHGEVNPADPVGFELRRQQTATIVPICIAFPVAIMLWLGTYSLRPPLLGMEVTPPRLVFSLKCCCVAILFCFVTGIEAVAHERLRSPAIDRSRVTRRIGCASIFAICRIR